MSHQFLHREDAPFSAKVWEQIDNTVLAAAKAHLSARRLLAIQGPYGLGLKSLPNSDHPADVTPVEGVKLSIALAIPVISIQSHFALSRREIAAYEQFQHPINLAPVAKAAIACARQENEFIFQGAKSLNADGLVNVKQALSRKLTPWENPGDAAEDLIQSCTLLDNAGFHGPYTLGLAPKRYNQLFRRYPQGNTTELEHLQLIVTDGIVKIPSLNQGGILLNVGAQYVAIVLGQDLVTAFVGPTADGYEFVVFESLALRIYNPQAICVLK